MAIEQLTQHDRQWLDRQLSRSRPNRIREWLHGSWYRSFLCIGVPLLFLGSFLADWRGDRITKEILLMSEQEVRGLAQVQQNASPLPLESQLAVCRTDLQSKKDSLSTFTKSVLEIEGRRHGFMYCLFFFLILTHECLWLTGRYRRISLALWDELKKRQETDSDRSNVHV